MPTPTPLPVSAAVNALMLSPDNASILSSIGALSVADNQWIPQTGVVGILNQQKISFDTSSGGGGGNAPSTPTQGDWFIVQDAFGNASTHNITITPMDQPIMGSNDPYVISTNDAQVEFVFVGGERGWRAQVS